MEDSKQIVEYFQTAALYLSQNGKFDSGHAFRRTQSEAYEALNHFLASSRPDQDKLQSFFDIAAGLGKTAWMAGLAGAVQGIAEERGTSHQFKARTVMPFVNLMYQSKDDIEKFSPNLKGKIGLVGDGHYQLNFPMTLVTYSAWHSLTEAGVLGDFNTKVLWNDEGHNGTSNFRVSDIFPKYNGSTMRIAVTASADYDREKSVENTHRNRVYTKHIADAVRQGESVEYIQTQSYIIRLDPITKENHPEYFRMQSLNDRKHYIRAMKKKAWIERAVDIYRSKVDDRTGDSLSDNEAGFYISGTEYIDETVRQLNADETLKAKAEQLGCRDVAVGIHHLMSSNMQKERERNYKLGRYMALVNDRKYREGYRAHSSVNVR